MSKDQAFKFLQQVCGDLLNKLDSVSARTATQVLMEQALNQLKPEPEKSDDGEK